MQISPYSKIKTSNFLKKLLSFNEFIILGHAGPDGDCLGSQQALNFFLKSENKNTHLCSVGPYKRAEVQSFQQHFDNKLPKRKNLSENTAIVLMDCSTLDRTGWENISEYEDLPLLIVDHHKSASNMVKDSLILENSPSTTLIIQMIIETSGRTPSLEEAQAIFFGFATDTGFFRHLEPQHSWVFSYIERLSNIGISPNLIYKQMNPGKPLATQLHFGTTLASAKPHCKGKVITANESYRDIKKFGVKERSADQLYQSLQNISDSQVVILFKEESDNNFSISLRSSNSVDVSSIAKSFGGGGHAKASGFSYEGTSEDLLKKLLTIIEPQLEK